MRCKIIATGGMERSGTNYTNYFFFLHPKLKAINYPRANLLKKGMDYRDLLKMNILDIPFPTALQGIPEFKTYHEKQRVSEKFDGVCFKYDRGEEWLKDVLKDLAPRSLFIYCYKPVYLLYNSWKIWTDGNGDPNDFVRNFKNSVTSALALRGQAERGLLDFATMQVTQPMEAIRFRFEIIMEHMVQEEMSPMQELYLKERRVVGGTFPRIVDKDAIMEELCSVDKDLDSWIVRYNSLRSAI